MRYKSPAERATEENERFLRALFADLAPHHVVNDDAPAKVVPSPRTVATARAARLRNEQETSMQTRLAYTTTTKVAS